MRKQYKKNRFNSETSEMSNHSNWQLNEEDARAARFTQPITVLKTPEEPQRKRQESGVLLCFYKWVTAIVLFVSMMSCLLFSKVALLWIAAHYKTLVEAEATNRSGNFFQFGRSNEGNVTTSKESVLIMITLVLIIPHVVSGAVVLWLSRNKVKLPYLSGNAVLWVSSLNMYLSYSSIFAVTLMIFHSLRYSY